MRRRDFLHNSGLLLPAMLASPSWATASSKTIHAQLLVIRDETTTPGQVHAVLNALPLQVTHLKSTEINHLRYTKNGFLITTKENNTIIAQKMVIYSPCQVNLPLSSVEISVAGKTFQLQYAAAKDVNRHTPEYWFLKTTPFPVNRLTSFINRDRHAVLCLSDHIENSCA